VDQTFESVTIQLDGNSFENCTFRDVIFQYSGGDLKMKNCSMDRFRFEFGGELSNGLFALYQLFGLEGLIQIIRGFADPTPDQVELVLPSSN
jgi:hypothetical protein